MDDSENHDIFHKSTQGASDIQKNVKLKVIWNCIYLAQGDSYSTVHEFSIYSNKM